jgi:dCTP diphosphatase
MSCEGSLSGRWRHCRGGSEPLLSPILIRVAELQDLTARMRAFSVERDWGRFHDVKSLTLALAGEVGEVAELVQWLPADIVVDGELQERLGDELADVLLYLVRLADVAGVDLGVVTLAKLSRNEARFPASQFRGVAPKHP